MQSTLCMLKRVSLICNDDMGICWNAMNTNSSPERSTTYSFFIPWNYCYKSLRKFCLRLDMLLIWSAYKRYCMGWKAYLTRHQIRYLGYALNSTGNKEYFLDVSEAKIFIGVSMSAPINLTSFLFDVSTSRRRVLFLLLWSIKYILSKAFVYAHRDI